MADRTWQHAIGCPVWLIATQCGSIATLEQKQMVLWAGEIALSGEAVHMHTLLNHHLR